MPGGSAPLEAPLQAPLDGAHAQLGCRTCDTTYAIPHDDRFQLRLLAFFDEHGPGHRPWVDLSAAGPLRIPRQRTSVAQREAAS